MTRQSPTFHRVAGALGAEVRGVDLREPLDDVTFRQVHDGLMEHQVLFFRGQDLSDAQHLALATRFGRPNVYPIAFEGGSSDPMTVIEDTPERPPTSDNWHTDLTWLKEPPQFAFLNARVIPDFGGDTLWASLYALYEALSPQMQRFCETLSVVHSPGPTFFRHARRMVGEEGAAQLERDHPPVEHPLVWPHPVTGRKALFIAHSFVERIVGLTEAESRLLLDHFDHLLDDPNHYVRWRWQASDLAIWDERCTNHRALSDHFQHFPQHRMMRRCTVGAQRPVAVAG